MKRATYILALIGLILTTGFSQGGNDVATVYGDPITVSVFQQRVRLARWMTAQQLLQIVQTYGPNTLTDPNSPYNGQYKNLSDNATFAQQVLDGLITLKLVQHEAAARGISVSDDEVKNQINAFFGYAPNGTPAPPQPGETPQPPMNSTEMAQAFQDTRDNYFGQAGDIARMGQADVIATFAEQALQVKVFDALTKNVPPQAQQVKVRHILVDSLDKANALLEQIKGGASFADVAKANSQDATSAVNGGDLGWSPHGVYFPEFEDAIWKVTPGTLIGPIKTPVGYHLIVVEGREVRPLTAADLIRERDAVYRQWLRQARDKANVKIIDNWQALIPAEPTLKTLGLP